MLSVIIEELMSIIRDLTKSKIRESRKAKSGCPSLYALYKAMDRLAVSSDKFICTLESTMNGNEVNDDVVAEYEELVKSFEYFTEVLKNCYYPLCIYDKNLKRKIMHVLGSKDQRLRFWFAIFNTAGRKLKAEKRLVNMDHIVPPDWYHDQDMEEFISFENCFSFNDREKVRKAATEGRCRVSRIKSLQEDLADFIRKHCEYADLFA